MDEKIFFDHRSVKVTNARFIVGTQTYAMNGVTSVKSSVTPPERGFLIIVTIVGLLMLAGPTEMKVIGLLVAGFCIFIMTKQKSTYSVFLSISSGEVQALADPDEDFIGGVIRALNEALIHRG
jgi:hypothetical protein